MNDPGRTSYTPSLCHIVFCELNKSQKARFEYEIKCDLYKTAQKI